MSFSIMLSSLCQDRRQCREPLLLISYSGLVCDVILAIDLANMPVLWHRPVNISSRVIETGQRLKIGIVPVILWNYQCEVATSIRDYTLTLLKLVYLIS